MSSSFARPLGLRASAVVGVAIAFAILASLVAPRADAAAFRFWGYFQLKGTSWTFAQKGPDQLTPADGSVEGWRFAVAAPTDTRAPRSVLTFQAICGDTPAKQGTKRVGVVIDTGRAADAESGTPPQPSARCAQVPTNATGAQVLAAVAPVRTSKGLVCGVNGWPAAGCGGNVQTVTAAAQAKDQPISITVPKTTGTTAASGSTPVLLWVAVVALALALLGAVVVAARRRRTLDAN